MSDINERVGLNIRRFREDKGLSQEKLAERAGLHRTYIGQIERGEKNIGIRNLEKIANALQACAKDLLSRRNFHFLLFPWFFAPGGVLCCLVRCADRRDISEGLGFPPNSAKMAG